MAVPLADQIRLSHILADDLQPRIQWAYDLEQQILVLSGGGLTSWGLASQAQFHGNGDPNGNVTAIAEGDLYIDETGTPGLWIANGPGTVWTELGAGGGGAVSSVDGMVGAVSLTSSYQPLDSDLTAIAALATTSFGRGFLTRADAAAGRTYLGLGTAALNNTGDFDAAGAAAAAQAASQPLDSDLTAIAALTTTSFGRAFLALADAAAGRTALGLGSASLLADPITADHGGTGLTSLTAHALQVGNGTGTVTQLGPDASTTKILQAAGASADPAFVALSGDATLAAGGALTLASVGPGATGPLGSATVVPVVTIDAKGRVTGLTSATIAIPESAVISLVADLALKAPLASPALTGTPTAPTGTVGDSSTQIATDAFVTTAVNNAISGLNVKPDVAYASTSALPANTYANGSSGVGATLTGNVNGPLIIDGVTLAIGQAGERVLVAGEGTSANNGWYTITQVGVIAVSPYILTRATESDQAAEIGAGYLTGVVAPNTVTAGSNNGKLYISVAADPFVVGTTSITFSQVGSTYSADGTTLTLSGSTFSIHTQADQTILGNNSGGTAVPSALTAAQVRTLLGLVIGTNVQAFDADLTTYAGITPGALGQAILPMTTLTNHGLVLGAGASAPTALAPDAGTTKFLKNSVASDAPTWQTIAESDVTNLVTDLTDLQTQNALQAAQIQARVLADAGQYVCSGLLLAANASTLTSVSSTIATSLFNKTSHGLVANDTITFSGLTTTTGVTNGTVYFVSATGLTGSAFRVAATAGGTAITLGGTTEGSILTVTQVGKLDMPLGTSFQATTELNASAQTAISTTIASMADATNPKWVIVELDSSNVVQFNQGTAAANPAFPSFTTTRTPLGYLYIPANATTVNTLLTTNDGLAKLIDARNLRSVHLSRLLHTDVAETLLTNPGANTSLLGATWTIPANSLNIGDTIIIEASGTVKLAANSTVKIQSTPTPAPFVAGYTTTSLALDATNSRRWSYRMVLVVNTIGPGTSAKIDSKQEMFYTAASANNNVIVAESAMSGGFGNGFDSTAGITMDLQVTLGTGNASSTVSLRAYTAYKIPA